jgi:hypothetical protein
MRPIFGDHQRSEVPENPLNWNLMRFNRSLQRKDYNGLWLTESQTLRLWIMADSHPASKWPRE